MVLQEPQVKSVHQVNPGLLDQMVMWVLLGRMVFQALQVTPDPQDLEDHVVI